MTHLFRKAINAGTQFPILESEKRNIKIANFISVIFACAVLMLILNRVLRNEVDLILLATLIFQVVLILSLVYLNAIGWNLTSRVLLCWLPQIIIILNMVVLINNSAAPESSHYVGMRIFQVALSCFPFLVFRVFDWKRLAIACAVPAIAMIFYDNLLQLLGVGYYQRGLSELSYSYNTVRTFVAFFIVGSSFIFLKRIIEKQEILNSSLIDELAEKNKIIRREADDEVSQLNKQLMVNLEELSKREFILKNSQKIAKVGSWEYNLTDRTLYFSDQMFSILGVQHETNMVNPRLTEFFSKENAKIIRSSIYAAIKAREEKEVTILAETVTGSYKWLRIIGYPTVRNKRVVLLSGIVHDITFFKESEEKILKSEQNYRSLFEQASDAIMVTNDKGQFIDVNSSMCWMLGYDKSELLQMKISELIDPAQLKARPIPFKELLAGTFITSERSMIHKSGRFVPVEANVKGFGGTHVMAIARDISDRKQTAQKLLKSIRELALLNTITIASSNATDVRDLLEILCRTLVTEGGYKLVWIGDEFSEGKKSIIKPIVAEGPAVDYVKDLVVNLDEKTERLGPTAQAMLLGKTTIASNLSDDLRYSVWREKAGEFGLQSSIGLLIDASPVEKLVLNVYSANADSFDDEEVAILERIVGNVGSAIRAIHASMERDEAKRQLVRTYERLSYHINNTPLAVVELDQDLRVSFWNKRAEELFGWSADEVFGRPASEFIVYEEDRKMAESFVREFRNGAVNSMFQERRSVTKGGRILFTQWYYSILRNESEEIEAIVSFVSDVTEQRTANRLLGKRIKELTVLYEVSQLIGSSSLTTEQVAAKFAEMLPNGFQYPEICGCKLNLLGNDYLSSNYRASTFSQHVSLMIGNFQVGYIDVVYTEHRPTEFHGPFLREELELLKVLKDMLQNFIIRKQHEDELARQRANLNATINNTETMIWSLDRHFKLLTYNEPFAKWNIDRHNVILRAGVNHRELISKEIADRWESRYLRALSGEIVTLEENIAGVDLRYSLNPIIEKERIIGVSIFAHDITESKRKNLELAEANKKIADLKVMALRSVMNPHFIFNVLSSIQFFITRNDQRNAINYLTSFSKLMRTVLTRSVADSVTLKEEIDMLSDYINLERLRFDEKFTYELINDEPVDLENIRIPSLLIQPYVENAILHGLYNKDGTGKLKLRVKSHGDYLLVEIEDDGVGRAMAQQINASRQHSRKSMGTQLTEERLRLFNADSTPAVEYEDCFDDLAPTGTIVRIKIKITP